VNFFKTLISSFVNSFKLFWGKELIELLYLAYTAFGQIYYSLKIVLIHAPALVALLFTKTSSIAFLILYWFLCFDCLAFLRPSVDLKNYKYFLTYLLVAIKILSVFFLVFYFPYTILHYETLPIVSIATALFLALFGLFVPYDLSGLKIVSAAFLSLLCAATFIGFKSPIYHFLLMGYLNFERFLHWILYMFMFDKQLFTLFGLAGFFISPVMVFLILSVLDSRKTLYYQIYGMFRGLKLFFLNYPLSFLWFHLFRFLVVHVYKFFSLNELFGNLWMVLLFVFFYYFYLSFLTNIYVKKVHEQFLIYF